MYSERSGNSYRLLYVRDSSIYAIHSDTTKKYNLLKDLYSHRWGFKFNSTSYGVTNANN